MNLRTKTLLTISLIVLLLVLVIITSLINPGDIKTNFQLKIRPRHLNTYSVLTG